MSKAVGKDEEEAGVTWHEGTSPSQPPSYLGLQSGLLALPLLLQTVDFRGLLLQQRAQRRLWTPSFLQGHRDPSTIWKPKSQKVLG